MKFDLWAVFTAAALAISTPAAGAPLETETSPPEVEDEAAPGAKAGQDPSAEMSPSDVDAVSDDNAAPTVEPSPDEGEADAAPETKEWTDLVVKQDGTEVNCRVHTVAEGAYVTLETPSGRTTLPWATVGRVHIDRGPALPPLELEVAGSRLGAPPPASNDAPHIKIQTRDGRPVSLLRLRTSSASTRRRYSTGYDEVCRAPCERPIERGNNRFFVDRHPWTASKVFELPLSTDAVDILVRPGRVKLRKAGAGLMIAGAAGIPAAITLLALPTQSRVASDAGITLVSLSSLAIPVGAILFAISRAKAEVRSVNRGPQAAAERRRQASSR